MINVTPVILCGGSGIFRYSGMPAMVVVARAMLLYGVLYAGVFTFYVVDGVPRMVGLIQPMLLLLLVGASRAAARVWLGGAVPPAPAQGCFAQGADLRGGQCRAATCIGHGQQQ